MTTKTFNNKVAEIANKFNCSSKPCAFNDGSTYTIDTPFGPLQFTPSPSPKINLYTVYMRFTDLGQFNIDLFKHHISDFDTPSTHSAKWNLHYGDAEYTLDTLEERIDNMVYLNKSLKINQKTLA